MKTLAAALAPLWQRKWIWLAETGLLAVAFALLYVWLALPVSSVWYLLAHIAVALLVLALLAFAARLAGRVHGPIAWQRTLRAPWFALALAVWVGVGLWLPYQLLWWIPAPTAWLHRPSARLSASPWPALCSRGLRSGWPPARRVWARSRTDGTHRDRCAGPLPPAGGGRYHAHPRRCHRERGQLRHDRRRRSGRRHPPRRWPAN